jgi:hypothetical protein
VGSPQGPFGNQTSSMCTNCVISVADVRRYAERSLLCMTVNHPVRRVLLRWIEWESWDRMILLLIIINTICLGLYDPFDTPLAHPVLQHLREIPGGWGVMMYI